MGFGATCTSDNKDYGLDREKWTHSLHYTRHTQCEHFCEIKRSSEPFLFLLDISISILMIRLWIFKVHQEFSKYRDYNASTILVTSHASMNWHFNFSSLTESKYYDNYKSVVLLFKIWHAFVQQQNVYQILNSFCLSACLQKAFNRENSHQNMVDISYITIYNA